MAITERDEKLISNVAQMVRKVEEPKCPSCKHAPLEFHSNIVRTGVGHLVAVIWCSRCGHTLQMQFLGLDPQQAAPLIVRPS